MDCHVFDNGNTFFSLLVSLQTALENKEESQLK